MTFPSFKTRDLSFAVILIAAALLSACGLALDDSDRLERAQSSFDQGSFRAAIIDAKTVLQRNPDSAAARLLLGRASLAAGDAESAEKELLRSIELGSDKASVLPDVLVALNQLQKFESALVVADEALELGPGRHSDVLQMRGDALIGLGSPEQAMDSYRDALRLDPKAARSQLGLARSLMAMSDVPTAIAELDRLTDMEINDPQVLAMSAELNSRAGRQAIAKQQYAMAISLAQVNNDEVAEAAALTSQVGRLLDVGYAKDATNHLARLQEIAPGALQTRILEARLAIETSDWSSAQKTLQQIVNQAPEFKLGRFLLGVTYLHEGKYLQAEVYLADAVRIDPENAEARRLLAETRLRLDKFSNAEEAMLPLLDSSIQSSEDLLMAAKISFAEGDSSRAADYLQRIADSNPDNPDLGLQVAMALVAANKLERADALLERIDAKNDQALAFRRDALNVVAKLQAENMDEARSIARSLTEVYPENAQAYELLGAIDLFAGAYEAAQQNFEIGSRLGTDYVIAQRNFALVDSAQGNLEAAAGHYRRILSFDPESVWAMLAMARIEQARRNTGASIDWLEGAAKIETQGSETMRMLAGLYVVERRFEQATSVIAEALSLHPNDAEIQFMAGVVAFAQGDYDDAVLRFSRAVDLDPDRDDYRLQTIIALDKSGRSEQARKMLFSTDAEILLESLPAATLQVRYFLEQQELEAALELSARLRDRHRDESIPHALLGEVHAALGDYLSAARAYDDALRVNRTKELTVRAFMMRRRSGLADRDAPLEAYLAEQPGELDIMLVLGESRSQQEDNTGARRVYEEIVRQDPTNSVALNNLAWVYLALDDERALETARRAYDLLPANASVKDTYGWMLVVDGQISEGIVKLRSAYSESPANGSIALHLAEALLLAGKLAEARHLLDNLLMADIDESSRLAAELLLADLNS